MNVDQHTFLAELEGIISDRRSSSADESYTARLFAAGTKRVAQKVGEEGVELALAAALGDQDEIRNEAADLVYHLLVLLAQHELELADVVAVLQERHRD